MGKQGLKYAFVLIATYLVISKATGFGTAVKAGGGQAVSLTKALQGR